MRVVITGAGITGASIARVLSLYEDIDIYIIDKEPDAGWGVSKANTGIIHPGHEDDPLKTPLRAKLCSKGNRIWRKWVKELDIPSKWPGELMLAFNDKDLKEFNKYIEWGKKNNVEKMEVIDYEKLKSLENNVSPNAVGALWVPSAGQISPWEAVIALIENAAMNGVKTLFGTKVLDIVVSNYKVVGVKTERGFIEADIVINATGLYADVVSSMAGLDFFTIHPRKGEYYVFDENSKPKVSRIIHPTPTPITKGVYVVTTVDGSLMLGPSAKDLPPDMKEDTSTTFEGLEYVWSEAKKLVRELPPKTEIVKTFAGLRPEPSTGDFIIDAYDDPWGFINVAGIRSPGLTSAPAIAFYVVNELLINRLGLKIKNKKEWNPYRKRIRKIREMSPEELQKSIAEDYRYGKIVCTCRKVSEAEIVEAINRIKEIGATPTLDGVKFRTLAMFGQCQGSFCRKEIANIISREMKIPLWKITVKGKGSEYVIGDIKMFFKSESHEA